MSIHKIGSDLLRPLEPRASARRSGNESADDASRPSRADRIEISPQGRELAAKLLRASGTSETSATEIEARVADGFYDDPAVAEEVARRILDSGDLFA